MDRRIVEFIAALRAAGVRVSLAESNDAFRAAEKTGVLERDTFRVGLRTTLVKEADDQPVFEQLFPLYFGSGGPPLQNAGQQLTPEQRAMLAAALRALLQQMQQQQEQNRPERGRSAAGQPQQGGSSDALSQLLRLLRWLLSGQSPSREELDQAGGTAGLVPGADPGQQKWQTRRMMRALGMQGLPEMLEALWQALAEAGMRREAIEQLRQTVEANQEALEQQVADYVGAGIARRLAAQPPRRPGPELMDRPFESLSEAEADALRAQVRRLAASLRSRAALRQKQADSGNFDARRTMRANLRNGGVPLELRYKRRHLKPKLALICDVSTSMRHCAEFMLRLIYELQDQVTKARSFAFIDDMREISQDFATYQPDVAVERVLTRLPPGSYNTDLGFSLNTFCHEYLDAVDRRTTVIFVGDGRNNFNGPRLDLVDAIKRRARRIIWLNPEPARLWGSGDSDMPDYVPMCDSVHEVGNLAQLAAAVDQLLAGR